MRSIAPMAGRADTLAGRSLRPSAAARARRRRGSRPDPALTLTLAPISTPDRHQPDGRRPVARRPEGPPARADRVPPEAGGRRRGLRASRRSVTAAATPSRHRPAHACTRGEPRAGRSPRGRRSADPRGRGRRRRLPVDRVPCSSAAGSTSLRSRARRRGGRSSSPRHCAERECGDYGSGEITRATGVRSRRCSATISSGRPTTAARSASSAARVIRVRLLRTATASSRSPRFGNSVAEHSRRRGHGDGKHRVTVLRGSEQQRSTCRDEQAAELGLRRQGRAGEPRALLRHGPRAVSATDHPAIAGNGATFRFCREREGHRVARLAGDVPGKRSSLELRCREQQEVGRAQRRVSPPGACCRSLSDRC